MGSASRSRHTARLRVHGRIGRFVKPARRGVAFDIAFDGTPAVKDPVEAAGVPHKEVGLVRIDGVDAGLADRLHGGETVDVFALETQSAGEPPRFVLDVHLGRLAGYLRLLGVDTAYGEADDDALRCIAAHEHRVLLTRDVGLLKRTDVPHGAYVHSTDPLEQLLETTRRFDLGPRFRPYTRCSRCNAPVEAVPTAEVATHVPRRVLESRPRFSRCAGCGRVYWRGTHEDGLRRRFAGVGIDFPFPPASPSSPHPPSPPSA